MSDVFFTRTADGEDQSIAFASFHGLGIRIRNTILISHMGNVFVTVEVKHE